MLTCDTVEATPCNQNGNNEEGKYDKKPSTRKSSRKKDKVKESLRKLSKTKNSTERRVQ